MEAAAGVLSERIAALEARWKRLRMTGFAVILGAVPVVFFGALLTGSLWLPVEILIVVLLVLGVSEHICRGQIEDLRTVARALEADEGRVGDATMPIGP